MSLYRTLSRSTVSVLGKQPSTSDNTTQSLGSEDSTADAVSSLRALALSTLRPKKRKLNEWQTNGSRQLARPAVEANAVVLDYGSEESPRETPVPNSGDLIEKNSKDTKPKKKDDLEEGEISDDDTMSIDCPPVALPPTLSVKREPVSPQPVHAIPKTPLNADSVTEIPERHLAQVQAIRESSASTSVPASLLWVPSEDHVRPGLKMNMKQFNTVKELILDLLGWGVSPEYLIESGLSREVIYYTFTELNLRLPNGFDTSGLIPFPLPNSTAPVNNVQVQPPSPTVPPSQPEDPSPNLTELEASLRKKIVHKVVHVITHHPLPPKPMPFKPQPMKSAMTMEKLRNLQAMEAMEAQRRYELLARKAALASRKKKAELVESTPTSPASVSATSPSVSSTPAAHMPLQAAQEEAVEDFLKSMLVNDSIAPLETAASLTPSHGPDDSVVSSNEPEQSTLAPATPISASTTPLNSPDSMDIDSDSIPGLQTHQHNIRQPSQGSEPSPLQDIPTIKPPSGPPVNVAKDALSENDALAPAIPPSTSSTPVPSLTSSRAPTPSVQSVQPSYRATGKRGVKRPVAMDFVDFVDSDAGYRTHSPATVHSSGPPPYVKRKFGSGGGFAGLNYMHAARRCVIDLSDSEEEEPGGDEGGRSKDDAGPGNSGEGKALTISASPAQSSSNSRRLIPGSLEAKEEEIRRMKELIAQRQQERLRRLAERSRTASEASLPRSTPDAPLLQSATEDDKPTSTSALPASVGQDEKEHVPTRAAAIENSSEDKDSAGTSLTPPVDDSEAIEDIVMKDAECATVSTKNITMSNPSEVVTLPDPSNANTDGLPADAEQLVGKGLHATSQDQVIDTPVNVELQTSSAESVDEIQQLRTGYSLYDSPFISYPLLRSRSRVISDLAIDSQLTSYVKAPIPDLRPLKVAVMLREVANDPERRLCQYEVPGGGVCRDQSCTDMHLGDLDPSDHETARYLLESMPDTLKAYDESEIADQLVQARQKKNQNKNPTQSGSAMLVKLYSLEDVVAEAIAALIGR